MKYREGLIFILLIVEIFMASFIIYTEAKSSYTCVQGFHCQTVLNSPYSHILGISISYIGLVAFVILFIVFFLHYKKKIHEKVFITLSAIGALGALYFISVQYFLIGVFCSNCLITDLTMLIIAILAGYDVWKNKNKRR